MSKLPVFRLGSATSRISQFAHNHFKSRYSGQRFVSTLTPTSTATSSDKAFTCIDYFCISNQPVDDDPPQRGAHVLDVDLRLPHGRKIPSKTILALERRVEERLAEIVASDNKKEPEQRIDSIRATAAGPTKDMWISFKELNPRHLSIIGGFTEECYFKPLRFMTTWNRLESIQIAGVCTQREVYVLPSFVLRSLKVLDIDMCVDVDMRAEGGAEATLCLEELNIHTNDVGMSALRLLKHLPCIKGSLRRLSIHSTLLGYDWEEERTGIRRMLMECTKLTDVKLSLRLHHAVYIAAFFPSTMQRLEFASERSMAFLQLIDDWIARAKDPTWAPNLRFLKFTVDRRERPMPDRFFLAEIRGDDEERGQTYPPGVPVTLAELSEEEIGLTSSDQDPGPDKGPFEFESFIYNTKAQLARQDLSDTDLNNLPGIGPHPNHVPKKVSERRRGQKEITVSDEALAEFEVAFAAKKGELYKILRHSRPGIELV